MAGIYVHIPFCKSRCIYCDFYSTTRSAADRAAFVDALCEELAARRGELPAGSGEKVGSNATKVGRLATKVGSSATNCATDLAAPATNLRATADGIVRTVYFGGGTPSWLGAEAIGRILREIIRLYRPADGAEMTLEANPDDITPAFARAVRAAGFNRVSLGIQTFDDRLLRLVGRRHTALEARRAVATLAEAGLENLSVDLIYGLPGQSLETWRRDVQTALALPVSHLSAYSLTYEPGTRLTALRDRGLLREAGDELSAAMYEALVDMTAAAGFVHYEISNFARPGRRSRHNSSYWDGTPYLGFGPGAHSYDGARRRRSNDADLAAYLAAPGRPPHSVEVLTDDERCDERVFTALRTRDGLDMERLASDFGRSHADRVAAAARRYVADGLLRLDGACLALTRRGVFLSDMIMADLMADT